ncbi:BLUF domain-containing protein [Curtobacterium sp. MCSS17_007]|uniref:BLUF domain-containing protein n=1 Tax=Curtobacterium sp. MCSS17_007 TaxID=2175646 RepID=UPI0021ACE77E|nr:BLUF domain-containing protein [Curtobacterium sp. MCSS17_007]WIE75859.1 BLUF domain-containing protein [Curtobacterium sp. MCSS17_007]
MLSLIYSSVATRPLGDDDLAALLAQSRRLNAANDITGVLLFRNGYFLQLLEGPDQAVRSKMDTIKHDDRHTKVTVLTEELIEERQFPEWTMGYPAAHTDVEQAPGYRSTSTTSTPPTARRSAPCRPSASSSGGSVPRPADARGQAVPGSSGAGSRTAASCARPPMPSFR